MIPHERPRYFVLNEHGEPVPCEDVLAWGMWFQTSIAARIVARDLDEAPGAPPVQVSTVFLAMDHSWLDGPPILYETLVFGGPLDGEMERYTSRAEALEGHQEMCRRVREALGR